MVRMMRCPICKADVVSETDVEDREKITCTRCQADLVVRDKKAFKGFDLLGAGDIRPSNSSEVENFL